MQATATLNQQPQITHENYYFQSFKEETQYGKINVKQGILKNFPRMFQCKNKGLFSNNDNDQHVVMLKKNLKIMCKHEEGCIAQIITGTKKLLFVYICYENMFAIYSFIKHRARWLRLQVQAKPQVIKITNNLYALWFKTMAQMQIVNINNMTVEQTIILPRQENWLQVERMSSCYQTTKIDFCFRNIRSMMFYKLDLEASPCYSFTLIHKKDLVNCPSAVVHLTMISESTLIAITNESISFDKMKIAVVDRHNKQISFMKMNVNDKILLLNQKYSTLGEKPIIIKLQNHQLGVLMDIQKGLYNYDIFRKLNAINQVISQSKNCGVYLQEYEYKVKIFILRKLDDGRGNLWKISIGKTVLRKMMEEIKSNYVIDENARLPACL
eukprot:403369154